MSQQVREQAAPPTTPQLTWCWSTVGFIFQMCLKFNIQLSQLTPIAVFLSQMRLSATGTTVEATNTPVNR